jgi:hypothetical protein
MPSLTKQQLDSAQEFATASIAALKSGKGIHPGTVIAATARMAGTYFFRSFRLSLPGVLPGQVVLSDKANSLGPTLIETTGRLLGRMGITLDPSQACIPVQSKDQPTLGFLETQRILELEFLTIRIRFGFNDEETAYAVAAATSLLIRHCAKALDPHVGFSIAALGFVEGTKTAPDPVVQSDGPA